MTEYMVESKFKEGSRKEKFSPVRRNPYTSFEQALKVLGELKEDRRYDYRIVAREVTKWRRIGDI